MSELPLKVIIDEERELLVDQKEDLSKKIKNIYDNLSKKNNID